MNKDSFAYDVYLNFSMMFNQLADFPMLTSRVFTFQMLCLMYKISPHDMEKILERSFINLTKCLIFNNDYKFYKFKHMHTEDSSSLPDESIINFLIV